MVEVTLAHGAGGSVMGAFIKSKILPKFSKFLKGVDVPLSALDDSGVIEGIAFTTDAYTVKPIFFPGGDIGVLAVCGTINDLAVMGARPIALSCGLVIEEGFPFEELEKILESISITAEYAEVPIVTGDTKVVESGGLDKIIVITSGIGKAFDNLSSNIEIIRRKRVFNEKWLKDSNLSDGDKLIITGGIGEHGIAIISKREGYGFETDVKSDVCALHKIVEKILEVGGIVAMKDPTRGGLANTLYEWHEKSNIGIVIDESKIPVKNGVKNGCELLGIEPLELANEGKVLIGVIDEKAEEVLETLHTLPAGKDAAIIGECTTSVDKVVMRTVIGGRRIIQQPIGDPVPRIC